VSALRFLPPPVAVTPELAWMLARAFAPGEQPLPAAATGEVSLPAAVELAVRFGLAPRIGRRARAWPELAGSPLAAELARTSSHAAASQLRALAAARMVAAAADSLGIRCCFLKGVALTAMGAVAAGDRPLADVDVLVDGAAAEALAALLVEAGFARGGGDYPHQLAPLVHPRLGSVELHRHLPGVRVGRRRFATLADLERAGLLMPWPADGEPESQAEAPASSLACIPAPRVLLAHLIVHALAQHGFRPAAYPALRLLADLVDLGLAGRGTEDRLAAALPLLTGSVPAAEAVAAVAACRALAAGDVAVVTRESDAGRLLRHLLAGTLDAGYREALKLSELRHPLAEGGRVHGVASALWHALTPSRAQIDALHGRPRHAWGYAVHRVLRPFDLAWRAGRALLT
jgi:hypothetical protein